MQPLRQLPRLPRPPTPPPPRVQAGVDAAQLESYQQLWRMVVPEEQATEPISF